MTSYDTAAAIIEFSCDPLMAKQLTLHEAFGSKQPTSEAGSSSSQQLAPQEDYTSPKGSPLRETHHPSVFEFQVSSSKGRSFAGFPSYTHQVPRTLMPLLVTNQVQPHSTPVNGSVTP